MDYEYGEYCRRGHVPAFGSWDWNDAVPFTQCFETARQDRDLYVAGDLYGDHLFAPAMIVVPRHRAKVGQEPPRAKRATNKEDCSLKAAREYDAPATCPTPSSRRPAPKPVDEDLYTISPELVKAKSKRGNGGFGCFSRCFLPTRVS
ncbi:PREDICTED: uncharacterized protein LOC104822468 isoform X2 [Tarenaya hassleriana]|uniref:uncharacterized protein LOC104822468 isoform X2 n=1 Tax=Tarenaya hassleriana TaxID=28532 RepID=UPI00053C4358|nr:PREDICTED: uncharacterized protein LOC104822468 isoform X2 [Tarenaya hassleriana]